MAKAPAFQFYTRDWLASSKTRRMTLAERGLYVEMLAWQFEDGSLPDNPAEIAAMVGAPLADVEAAWEKVRPLFEERDGTLVNRRLERARKEWQAYQKDQSERGQMGNEVRWGKRKARRSNRRQLLEKQEDVRDRGGIAQGSPASASASALEVQDQNLNSARARELRNAEIETNGYVAVSDIPSVGAFLAGINTKVAEREALDFDDISYTLNAFFPPERPGAGTNPAVKAWLGRIPEQTLGSALRYLRVQTYTVDGEEKTWGQLTDEHCKRVITAGLNAILRERG